MLSPIHTISPCDTRGRFCLGTSLPRKKTLPSPLRDTSVPSVQHSCFYRYSPCIYLGNPCWLVQQISLCFFVVTGQQLWDRQTENKKGFPLHGLEPTQCFGFSRSVRQQREKRVFRIYIAHHRCHEPSPHRTRLTTKLGERMLHQDDSPCCKV